MLAGMSSAVLNQTNGLPDLLHDIRMVGMGAVAVGSAVVPALSDFLPRHA